MTAPAATARAAAPDRIAGAFAKARAAGRIALIPYLTAGYPSLAQSERLMLALAKGGADLIEIGLPFSDPLADGATVQRASHQALENGVRLADCIALAARLRQQHGLRIPLLFMGYYNPMLHYGLERFAADVARAGVDGVIVPDLPVEESDDLLAALRAQGRDLIFLVAPTSTDERIAEIAAHASGFIYCVSLTGVTGKRAALPEFGPYLQRVRAHTDLPLAIGFGISTPEHVRQVAAVADGAVVGSALINLIDSVPEAEQLAAVEEFLRSLATGARRQRFTHEGERGGHGTG